LHSLHQALRPLVAAALALALALGVAAVASGAPTLSILSGPDGPTSDTAPSFTFEVDESATAVECSIDQGTPVYGACTGATAHSSESPLADGDYTFRVRAVDAAEEETVETRSFTVDTAAPPLTIVSGPDGPTDDDSPAFGFDAEAGSTVECSVDQGSPSWGPCSTANSHSPATLTDGTYTFRVRATDGAANETVRTRGFTVDTVAPETTITSLPHGTTDDASPSFSFSASEGGVSFECRLDGPDFSPCSSPKSYGTLSEGVHTFAVRARDAAGNVGAETAETLTIDLTNPTLAIVSGPDGPTNDATPSFGFDAEAGSTVECSVDQGSASWGPCSGAATHAAGPLADGTYTFRVRATDGAAHQTTQTRAFTVDTVAPTTTIGSGPTGPSNDPNPAFGFGADESGVTFECRRDAESFAPCASPKAYANLPDGAHGFHVRATDAAGNVATVVSRSFSVDTVAPAVAIGFGPTGTTTDDSPLFEFAASGDWSAVECSIDQGTPSFGACSSDVSHAVAQRLAPGTYTFRVRASDLAGNSGQATRTFTVATTPVTPPADPPTTPPVTPPTVPAPPADTAPKSMTPFPLVRLSGRVTTTGAKVQILSVRAPRGATIRVRVTQRCATGARCPAKVGSVTVSRTGLVRLKRFEVAYGAGTTIEIRVSQAGLIGKYTRFAVRRGKAPQRLDRCLKPGSTKASACTAG
jgi:hypothetical protein